MCACFSCRRTKRKESILDFSPTATEKERVQRGGAERRTPNKTKNIKPHKCTKNGMGARRLASQRWLVKPVRVSRTGRVRSLCGLYLLLAHAGGSSPPRRIYLKASRQCSQRRRRCSARRRRQARRSRGGGGRTHWGESRRGGRRCRSGYPIRGTWQDGCSGGGRSGLRRGW